jgi:hypothetical protein
MKAAIFHPGAGAAIRSFPKDVRRELGKAIFDLQKGAILAMPLSWPMPSIEPGAAESATALESTALSISSARCGAF